ncbi:MAG: LPS assembly lipoprotein LptE [Limnobacter sp.]|nr:LPS assembly lipoprotein LptE [Limnobacter sp.]
MRVFQLRWLVLVLGLSILAGCGFQLRGQADFDFDRVKRQGLDKVQMSRIMDMALTINGLEVNVGQSPVTLTLIDELRERSIVTFSATGRAREVRITYTLTFSVKDAKSDFLIADTSLTQQRELTYSDEQILGKEAEENRLFKEMQEDIARQIVTRLGNVSLR